VALLWNLLHRYVGVRDIMPQGHLQQLLEEIRINLTLDRDKVSEDAETVKEKAEELTGKATEAAKGLGDQTRDKVKSESKTEDEIK
jgi:hypothetical protein